MQTKPLVESYLETFSNRSLKFVSAKTIPNCAMADIAVESRILNSSSSPNTVDKKDSAYKRSNKPFMEKKRRARINNCLSQLKTLVLHAMRKDTNQYSKLEKADILEMTVKHLRQLQRQQVSTAMSHDPTVVTKYKAGFNECANEVVRYLSSVQGVEPEVRNRLMGHLGNLVSQVNQQPQEQCPPLNVQIPQVKVQGHQTISNGCLLMPASIQTSPLVLQPVQNVNVQNVYTTAQNGHPLPQRSHMSPTQFCGSFQIVPGASSQAPVAVYLGQSPNMSQSIQSSSINCRPLIPLYSSHTPPRTKASMKAFDSSAFCQVSSFTENSNSSSSTSTQPSQKTSLYSSSNLDLTLHGLAVKCGRTPSPLKVEDVWRPW